MEAAMSEPQQTATKIDFCELKHVLADAHPLMTDEQLLEVADDVHDEPKSGPSACPDKSA
jgi:hypothetical protein